MEFDKKLVEKVCFKYRKAMDSPAATPVKHFNSVCAKGEDEWIEGNRVSVCKQEATRGYCKVTIKSE